MQTKDNRIKCLECHKLFIRPASHVWQVHNLSAREYKELHGLDVKRGIATEEYRERMREHVLKNGTIANLQKGEQYRFKKGDSTVGKYKRSKQSIERLRAQGVAIGNLSHTHAYTPKVPIACHECGKQRMVYPRYVREGKHNYCGIPCRNKGNNRKRTHSLVHQN